MMHILRIQRQKIACQWDLYSSLSKPPTGTGVKVRDGRYGPTTPVAQIYIVPHDLRYQG